MKTLFFTGIQEVGINSGLLRWSLGVLEANLTEFLLCFLITEER